MTIVGSGSEDFGTWSYTEAGVYYYSISEVNVGEDGYAYDTGVYTITDSVKDVAGRLELTRTVTSEATSPLPPAALSTSIPCRWEERLTTERGQNGRRFADGTLHSRFCRGVRGMYCMRADPRLQETPQKTARNGRITGAAAYGRTVCKEAVVGYCCWLPYVWRSFPGVSCGKYGRCMTRETKATRHWRSRCGTAADTGRRPYDLVRIRVADL